MLRYIDLDPLRMHLILFYGLLPYDIDYVAYDVTHVLTQLQLLAFAGLAFVLDHRWITSGISLGLAISFHPASLRDDCRVATVLVALYPIKGRCREPALS